MNPLVLVVDDHPVVLKLIGKALAREGCTAVLEHTAAAAMRRAAACQPHVAVVDTTTEGASELCSFLRTRAVRVVALVDAGAPRECPADGIVRKPFTAQELLAAVRRALDPTGTP